MVLFSRRDAYVAAHTENREPFFETIEHFAFVFERYVAECRVIAGTVQPIAIWDSAHHRDVPKRLS